MFPGPSTQCSFDDWAQLKMANGWNERAGIRDYTRGRVFYTIDTPSAHFPDVFVEYESDRASCFFDLPIRRGGQHWSDREREAMANTAPWMHLEFSWQANMELCRGQVIDGHHSIEMLYFRLLKDVAANTKLTWDFSNDELSLYPHHLKFWCNCGWGCAYCKDQVKCVQCGQPDMSTHEAQNDPDLLCDDCESQNWDQWLAVQEAEIEAVRNGLSTQSNSPEL